MLRDIAISADLTAGVQPVSQEAYQAVLLLGERGGWESLEPKKRKSSLKRPLEQADGGDSDGTTGMGEKKGGARKKTTRSGVKRVRISVAGDEEEESELSDLPEDREQERRDSPSKVPEVKKKKPITPKSEGTRRSSRKN